MVTKQQIEYLLLYQGGFTQQQIADKYGVNRSTVCRVLKRAIRKTCPFASNCLNCPLPECMIKDEYAFLLNNNPK